jgi:hypothetical protein
VRNLLSKRNIAIAASVVSAVASAALLRKSYQKMNEIRIVENDFAKMRVDDVSEEEVVEAVPVTPTKKV